MPFFNRLSCYNGPNVASLRSCQPPSSTRIRIVSWSRLLWFWMRNHHYRWWWFAGSGWGWASQESSSVGASEEIDRRSPKFPLQRGAAADLASFAPASPLRARSSLILRDRLLGRISQAWQCKQFVESVFHGPYCLRGSRQGKMYAKDLAFRHWERRDTGPGPATTNRLARGTKSPIQPAS